VTGHPDHGTRRWWCADVEPSTRFRFPYGGGRAAASHRDAGSHHGKTQQGLPGGECLDPCAAETVSGGGHRRADLWPVPLAPVTGPACGPGAAPSGYRGGGVETGMAHQVSVEELRVGRARGNYQGFCGTRFRAASMLDPGRGQCQPCREQAAS
jgi:hypothetical protein